ncbi:MAG: AI-2E family transporter [Anaerolineales bacterium]|jgi:predicted PurR-regulated permease PerM|nr:AI-2E family transporter [Anaerolineales bacterium]
MQSPPWSSTTRLIVALLIITGLLALVIFAFPFVESLLIAALLAFLINPLVHLAMRKLRLKRPLAAALVYFFLLIVVISIPAVAGALAVSRVGRLGAEFQSAIQGIEEWISQPVVFFGFDFSPRNVIQNLGQSAGSAFSTITGSTFDIISGITTNFLWILLVLFSLYYFLKDGPRLKPWLVGLASPAYQADLERLFNELEWVWSVFMRIQLLIFFILAVLFSLGTLLVVWLYQLGLIPFSTLGLIVVLILVYALVQQVDNLWLRPQVLGSKLRLHPGLVIVGLLGGLAIGGVLLAIVIVPLIASVQVVGRYIRQKMLGLPAWPLESSDGS